MAAFRTEGGKKAEGEKQWRGVSVSDVKNLFTNVNTSPQEVAGQW